MEFSELYQLALQIHACRFGDFGSLSVEKHDGFLQIMSHISAKHFDNSPIVLAPRQIGFVTNLGTDAGESYLKNNNENLIIKHIHSLLPKHNVSIPKELFDTCSRLRMEKNEKQDDH